MKSLKYPSNPEHGEWYLWVNTGFKMVDGVADTTRVTSALLQICQQGDQHNQHIEGFARLGDDDFVEKWFALLKQGKKKVDALNFNPERGILVVTNQCANCQSEAGEDDFLCEDCRSKE